MAYCQNITLCSLDRKPHAPPWLCRLPPIGGGDHADRSL